MERDIFGEKTKIVQRPRTDRFVAPRSSLLDMRRRRSLSFPTENIDFWDPKYAKRRKYISYLNEALEIEQPKGHKSHGSMDTMQLWPCTPRKKSHLTSADSVLDLPTYTFSLFPDLLDWNSDDVLVAALDKKYHKYSWQKQKLVGIGFALSPVCCCKFDPRGELLALGTITNVEMHHHGLTKRLFVNRCLCNGCFITTLDWSPTGNSLVTGCSLGTIRGFSRTNENMYSYKCIRRIENVKISPNARFVAAIAMTSPSVLVLTWPSLQPYYQLESEWSVMTISWHPWSSALLGIVAVTSNLLTKVTNISLWDASSDTLRKACVVPSRYSVNNLLFSPRSGEMVLTLWNEEQTINSYVGSRIVILGDPDTIVDQWGEDRNYLDQIRTMVFSPDGTKLATATTGEDLIIWNFLPEDDKKKNKSQPRRFSALPVYLDQTTFGISLR